LNLCSYQEGLDDQYRFVCWHNYTPTITVKNSENADIALLNSFTTTETRLKTHIGDIPSKVSSIRNELQSDWPNMWLKFASGKNILTVVGQEDFSPEKTMKNIRELVSAKWDERQLPQEIFDLLQEISQR